MVYVFHRTDQMNKMGEAPVCAYVIIDGKKSGNFALGLVCTPESLGSAIVQGQIALAKRAIEDIHTFLSLSQKMVSANDVKNEYILRKKGNRVKVIQSTIQSESKPVKSPCFFEVARMMGKLHIYLVQFERWAKANPQYQTAISEVKELVVAYLSRYDKNTSTAHVYFSRIKQVTLFAMEEGLIEKNPLRNLKYSSKKPEKLTYLTPAQLTQIADYKGFSKKLQPYVEMFLFACHTGLSLSDCVLIRKSNVVEYENRTYIIARRHKSSSVIRTELNEVAKEIWQKHAFDFSRLLPESRKSNRQYYYVCAAMKAVQRITGQPVTFHKARHTKAFELLNVRGASIDTVSTMLGHTNVSVTQRYYAEMSLEGLSKALDKLDK